MGTRHHPIDLWRALLYPASIFEALLRLETRDPDFDDEHTLHHQ